MGSPITDIAHDFTKHHGCASHSSATNAQQRIADVIAGLGRMRDEVRLPAGELHVPVSKVIDLLKDGVKKG